MEKANFNDLPSLVERVIRKQDEILALLKANQDQKEEQDRLLDVRELCDYLHLKPPTVYGLVYERRIPFEKFGKKLYFRKSEIVSWIGRGRKMELST